MRTEVRTIEPSLSSMRTEVRTIEPDSAVIIPQTEPPQSDNTLIETLTFQLRFVTIRKQREKNLSP